MDSKRGAPRLRVCAAYTQTNDLTERGNMIYKVAVVDDEPEILQRITGLLNKYAGSSAEDLRFETDTYSCGDELLKNDPNSYEILILDINMPGNNGLRVAKKIREFNKTAIIIFCTHYEQYAINGYEVNALGYILKPIDETLFNRSLDRMLQVLKTSQTRRIKVKTLHGVEVIPVSDIIYLEIQIHNLYYYVLNPENKPSEYRTRGSMQEMVDSLGDLGFARCSACYLINLRHVLSVVNGEVKLSGGITLPISRKFLRSFNEAFIKFLGRIGTLNV